MSIAHREDPSGQGTEPRDWREGGARSEPMVYTLAPGPPKLGIALPFIISRSTKSMSTIYGHQRKMAKWDITFVPSSKPQHPSYNHLPNQKLEGYPQGPYTMTHVNFQHQFPLSMDIHIVFYNTATPSGSQKSDIHPCSPLASIKD